MNKKQKQGVLMVLVGLCMVFAAMFLHLTQERQDAQAGENAAVLLRQLELSRMSVPAAPEMETQEETPAETVPAESLLPDMPEKEYLGYAMIGTLRIPSVGIELPILRDWSYELLNVAPCRYSGSAAEENMILMGHNYKSHFTPLHNIAAGAEVTFEDVNGFLYRYCVDEITYLHKTEGEALPSDHPLTLFTCTRGGQNRIVVRCNTVEQN
jgi:sortase A